MSMYDCSYCGQFCDTDDGCGQWDVKKLNSPKVYDFVCDSCCEKYLTEDGIFDENLPEKQSHIDKGNAMAAKAEDNQS